MKKINTDTKGWEFWRYAILYLGIGIVLAFYLFRLFSLQILQGNTYQDQALENRQTTVKIPTQRGMILDRNGSVLAQNIASYNVVITPADLPGLIPNFMEDVGKEPAAIQKIYHELSDLTGIPVSRGTLNEETVKAFTPCQTDLGIAQIAYIGDSNWPYDPIRIKCNVDEALAMTIREKSADWPGVDIEVEPVRDYPTGELTAEVIGFLGPISERDSAYYEKTFNYEVRRDKVGYAGIEWSMQDVLGGYNGVRNIEIDSSGKELSDLTSPVAAKPGLNVVLTIDTRLQNIAKTALIGEINYLNTRAGTTISSNGVVIAMNPKTGEVLSLVSYPTFENNRMARFIPGYYYEQLKEDANKPLFNHAISAEHPPGSVFKMAAAIGALNEGVIKPDTIIEDPGLIQLPEQQLESEEPKMRDYVCWPYKTTGKGHGDVDFLKGVSQSCDVYFYKIGGGFENEVPNGGLGIYRLAEYARALGYGELTGIELPGEAKGLIPLPDWKRINIGESWSTGDTYIATIGQGYVTSTAIQVLESFVTLVNDGKLVQPTLIKEVQDPSGEVIQSFQPKVKWDITKDPLIHVYDGKDQTGELKTVAPWTIQLAKEAMRLTVTDGTAKDAFTYDTGQESVPSGGKTGTAEYCDDLAQEQDRCKPGRWPAHAWYVGYAPYDNPEIVVVAFVYNGTEGSVVAAPVVRKVLDGYFELKAADAAAGRQ